MEKEKSTEGKTSDRKKPRDEDSIVSKQVPLTPSTDDPAKVLAPDDTFPGSGPSHPDRESR